jgi:hypothetical protein
VSYSVRFDGSAPVQLCGMPPAEFDALVERVTVLVDAPWDAAIMPLWLVVAVLVAVHSRSHPTAWVRLPSSGLSRTGADGGGADS